MTLQVMLLVPCVKGYLYLPPQLWLRHWLVETHWFLQKNCVSECFVEGDAEVIINAILARDTRNLEYGHLIGDILVLAIDLGLYNFSFVKRIDNLVAHFLARKVVLVVSFMYGLSTLLMI